MGTCRTGEWGGGVGVGYRKVTTHERERSGYSTVSSINTYPDPRFVFLNPYGKVLRPRDFMT